MTPNTVRIAPSILSADFARLGEEVRAIEAAGAALVHFDVMDNHYVPNLTIGPLVCEAIRPHVQIPIDVHLMVEPVDALIPLFAKAGANIITFHPEASRHVDRTLQLIRDHGCKAGIVLNPATPAGLDGPCHGAARHRAADEREPGLWRAEVHPLHAAQAARGPGRASRPMKPPAASRSGWKWTAASRPTTSARSSRRVPTPAWRAAPCLARRTPTAATAP